jgi:hypothetical protein
MTISKVFFGAFCCSGGPSFRVKEFAISRIQFLKVSRVNAAEDKIAEQIKRP